MLGSLSPRSRAWSHARRAVFVGLLCLLGAAPARALDRLCDPGAEDCRSILINYIRAETVGIDVGFWFMEDARYSNELIKKWQAGVPVRVLMDPRANSSNAYNADRLAELEAAGIPMRKRTGTGILHYKMMLFAGQGIVEFSGANYSADAWRPVDLTRPYENYTDESIYFTDDPAIVHSFMTKYDDLWTNTTSYADYKNITGPLTREYPTYTKDPSLNFPPAEGYASRAISRYNAETQKIDVIMFRITDVKHTNAIIAAFARGIPVRLITDPDQYREVSRLWDAYNVDRLYAAGIPIKMRAHAGLNHQKLVILHGQGMGIFGSSNWTSPSDKSQEEHNYFTTKPSMFTWFVNQFERKWNNTGGVTENQPFVPLPPDKPSVRAPANAATGVATASVALKWYGGPWGQRYDVYLGNNAANLQLVVADQELGPSESATDLQSFTATNLQPGTTYYWKVVSRTMAGVTKTGDLWSFTTAGTAAPPPAGGTLGAGDILLYGMDGRVTGSQWSIVSDSTAAGGQRLWSRNQNAAKLTTASASPASYVEFTFNAVAGQPYHLWMRGRAEGDTYTNDSVFVQFTGAVNSSGSALYKSGTTSAAEYSLENCNGCGVAAWGWQDNAYGLNVSAAPIYFAQTGPQTLRIQNREDGLSIDQIMLSPSRYASTAPGALKNDTTIYPRAGGSGTPPPPPPPASTALPTPWVNRDIGSVGVTGDSGFDAATSTFSVTGGGADVWGSADALQFAYQPLSGDGSIVARVATVQNVNAWTKAGVMIRETLSAGATQAFMLVSPGKGLAFQRRPVTGGSSVNTTGALAAAPYWVKLVRNGNLFSAYQSANGTSWTLVGTDTIVMGTNVFIGLGVSSHSTSTAAAATFTQVTVTGS